MRANFHTVYIKHKHLKPLKTESLKYSLIVVFNSLIVKYTNNTITGLPE